MEKDAGTSLPELRVDGGATANAFLMQFQADILGLPVVRPAATETTALGAAYLAGLAVGYWTDKSELEASRVVGRRFEPQMDEERRARLLHGWHRAVERAKGWVETEECGQGTTPI
jgi:glycerol kinase